MNSLHCNYPKLSISYLLHPFEPAKIPVHAWYRPVYRPGIVRYLLVRIYHFYTAPVGTGFTTLQVCNYHLIFSSFILLYFCYRDLLLPNLCRNPDPRTTCSSLASNHESRKAAIHEIPATKDIARVGITILPSCQSKFTDEI